MSTKFNRSDYFDKAEFLHAEDIKNGQRVTIDCFETAKTSLSEKARPILRLKGFEAPLGLNATNADAMVDLFGDDTDDWSGKKITLIKVKVTNPQTKKIVDGIRITK